MTVAMATNLKRHRGRLARLIYWRNDDPVAAQPVDASCSCRRSDSIHLRNCHLRNCHLHNCHLRNCTPAASRLASQWVR